MIELGKSDYAGVRTLYDSLSWNLVTRSIIDGNTIGCIFTDKISNPDMALLWNTMDTVVICLKNENLPVAEVAELIKDEIIPAAKKRYIPELNIYCESNFAKSFLMENLDYFSPVETERNYYEFKEPCPEIPNRNILPMSKELLGRVTLGNSSQVMGWILSFWPTVNSFLEYGFGYCRLVNDTIASWCLSVYSSGNERELGLATATKYRRRGYATETAAACLSHCNKKGLIPHWQCDVNNRPSVALAEKLGFKKAFDYYVVHIEF